MPAPLSKDLRQRIWQAYQTEGCDYNVLAQRFQVSVSTVGRLVRLRRDAGTLEPLAHGPKGPRKFMPAHRQAMEGWLQVKPDLYLHEIQQRLSEEFELQVSCSHLCRVLNKMGLSRKKNR